MASRQENPQSVPLPPQPRDRRLRRPPAPSYPPTMQDVLEAVGYSRSVDKSFHTGPIEIKCTRDDVHKAILFEHAVVSQAAAAAAPQVEAPPWFQPAVQDTRGDIQAIRRDVQDIKQDMRREILPQLARLVNRGCGGIQLRIVPFINGDNPTEAPYNLPPLHSARAVDELDLEHVFQYLNGYGLEILPDGGPDQEIEHKDMLKQVIGAMEIAVSRT